MPSLTASLMNVTVLYSTSRERENRKLTDLYFNPPLERVGMLEWHKLEGIVAQSHEYAERVLNGLAADALKEYVS